MPAPNDHTTSAASNVGSSTPRSNKTPESLAAYTALRDVANGRIEVKP
jgi:hypothetical protein